MTVMIESREQVSSLDDLAVDAIARSNGVVELSSDLALHHSDLIEGVIAMAFDVLGCKTLDIRIRPRLECIDVTTQEKTACQVMN
jgi:hypothetical protein